MVFEETLTYTNTVRGALVSYKQRDMGAGGRGTTDPQLKHLEGIGGARSGRSRVGPTKKRADLGSSCHVGHGSATLVVGAIERQKLRKPGLMSPTEKPAQTRRICFLGFCFGRVDPNTTRSQRQTPPIAIARSFQHAEKSPFFRRGGSPPPL